jgi:hypothetical protein
MIWYGICIVPRDIKIYVYTKNANVQSITIHASLKVETIQLSINDEWTNNRI